MSTPFKAQELYDSLSSFGGGVNEGDSPLDLPKSVLAGAINVSVRGKFASHRPSYYKRVVTYATPATKTAVETGYFQGACYCQNDAGVDSLMALINGRLYQFVVNLNVVTCTDVTAPSPGMPTIQPQAWLWQAENFIIVNDGLNNPLFFDSNAGTTATSTYTPPVPFTTTTTADFTVPAIGTSVTISVTLLDNLIAQTTTTPGDIITVPLVGTFQVITKSAPAGPGNISALNLTGTPLGIVVASGTTVSWVHQGTQLPPGRMGTYWLGRNWISLVDGKQYVASDIVGGASGTQADNFRDAVLSITENLFLVGGGNFTVPGSVGTIKAIRGLPTLDVSLGQGPVMIFTDSCVFSNNAPLNRLTWQYITNPIQTVSLVSNGATGQNSTTISSGDGLFRSIDGERSLIQGRRDFDTWGNVPISFEVSPILDLDDPGLLLWGSSVVFNNRLIQTTAGVSDVQGIYWKGYVVINFDEISSLRGKAPSVWEGLWTGLNTLQLVGDGIGNAPKFNNVERCFSFVLNTTTGAKKIEIWEILKDGDAINDNDGTKDIPITWQFDSASLKFGVNISENREYMQLNNGELWISDMVAGNPVSFQVQWLPDQYPCWVNWFAWQECATSDASNSQPQYRPRMGLGSPSPSYCDPSTNRPLRNGFTFQVRTIIQGHCTFMGAYFEANTASLPKFAPQSCTPLCISQ